MQRVSQKIPALNDDGTIAVYRDELTAEGLVRALGRAVQAFPSLSKEQLEILKDRMIENGCTDQRAIDAVNHVIDNFEGWNKTPNIANFIGFDRRIKTLTHRELNLKHDKGEIEWDDYVPVDVGLEKPKWVKREEVVRYGLKRWVSPGTGAGA